MSQSLRRSCIANLTRRARAASPNMPPRVLLLAVILSLALARGQSIVLRVCVLTIGADASRTALNWLLTVRCSQLLCSVWAVCFYPGPVFDVSHGTTLTVT